MGVVPTISGHLLSALLCLDAGVLAATGDGQRCWMKTTNIFADDVDTSFSCPRPGDPDHFTDCCGSSWQVWSSSSSSLSSSSPSSSSSSFSWQRKCCAPSKFNPGRPIGGGSVISFFGIVVGVVILVVCLVLICCCCTPCCLLAKQRRRRGMVTSLLFPVFYLNLLDVPSSGSASTSSFHCWSGAKHDASHLSATPSSPSRPSSTTRVPESTSPLPWAAP